MKTQFSMQKAKAFATQLLWEFIPEVSLLQLEFIISLCRQNFQ